jgi:hypothetical protein
VVRDEIRQVRRDLLEWARTKPDPVRIRAVYIVGNLYRLEHWPDDRLTMFETLRNIRALEHALGAATNRTMA